MRSFIHNVGVFEPFVGVGDRMTVVLEGTRILAVGRGQDIPAPAAGDQQYDGGGMTIMPGMTVGHWHPDYPDLRLDELSSIYISQQKPPAYLAALSAKNLKNALMSGFTAVSGAGCGHDVDASLKMAIEEGVIEGPRIRAAGHHINTTGSDNDRAKWWYGLRPPYQDGVSIVGAELFADGVDAMRRAVRDEINRGVEIIKIFPTGGHGIAPVPHYRGMTNEELRVICETAHDRGAVVRAHVCGREAILECIAAGVDIIDHGDGADDECIEAMVKAGSFLIPSMIFLKSLLRLPRGSLPDAILLPVQQDFDGMLDIVPRAHKAGVKIIPGDDYGVSFIPHVPGIYAQDLMIHIDEAGMAPRDVLGWATSHGAKLMNRDDLGHIAAGMTADLLVVAGNPEENPALLTDPEAHLAAIVIDGNFVRNRLPARQVAELAAE